MLNLLRATGGRWVVRVLASTDFGASRGRAGSIHINGMLLQALVQLDEGADQEGPTAPESAEACLVLGPGGGVDAEARAQREADAAHEVPQADVPAQHGRVGLPPALLGLEHEQGAGDDEAGAADDLRGPVGAVERGRRGQVVQDARQRRQPRDPEHRRPEQLRRAGQEPDLVQVVLAQLRPRREPHPRAAVRPVVHAVVVPLLVQLHRPALHDFAALGALLPLRVRRRAAVCLLAFADKV